MKFYFFSLLFFVLTLSCREVEIHYQTIQGEAQGTTFSIQYKDSLNRDFSQDIAQILNDFDKELSTYLESSWVTDFNKETTTSKSIKNTSYLPYCIQKSYEWEKVSGGYFTIGIKNLVDLQNYTSASPYQIDSVLQIEDSTYLADSILYKLDTRTKVDFNAIAQGYSVDVLADFLESKGVENYFVEIGGELRVKGESPRGGKWKIGLESPNSTTDNRAYQKVLEVTDVSVATSGSYRKFKEIDGVRYSHAIDPLTGKGVTHNLLSVTVVTPLCIDADALATAFLVMGEEKSKALIKHYPSIPVEAYFIKAIDSSYSEAYTQGFSSYLP